MEVTKKQLDAWIKVRLKNYMYMLEKRSEFENKDRLFDIYTKLLDKIYNE